jgi:hypothetical protein
VALLGLCALALASGRPARAAGIEGCALFPPDSIWNTRVDSLPVHPRSGEYIASIGAGTRFHPDFGAGTWEGGPIGIPFVTVSAGQAGVGVSFEYDDQSDPGPYPIPADPPIEGGPSSDGDRHVLILDRDHCRLYEIYAAYPAPGGWAAGSGAIWDLGSHALRPATWTSADAAGLPILPGLVRYDEVASGEITHAIRFTARYTQRAFVWPARHYASDITDPGVPPMGQRFRLKPGFDLSGFPPEVQVILRGFQRYGLIRADNGSDWYVSGVPDPRWDDEVLGEAFHQLRGSDFEAVDVSGVILHPDSGQAGEAAAPGVSLSFQVNQTTFGPGDELRLDASLAYTGAPLLVDVYVAVRLPDGTSTVFLAGYPSPALVSGSLDDDPRSFPALARGVPLLPGFAFDATDLLVYGFTGQEPPGEYEVLGAVTPAGAFDDGVVDPGDLLVFASQRLTVTP